MVEGHIIRGAHDTPTIRWLALRNGRRRLGGGMKYVALWFAAAFADEPAGCDLASGHLRLGLRPRFQGRGTDGGREDAVAAPFPDPSLRCSWLGPHGHHCRGSAVRPGIPSQLSAGGHGRGPGYQCLRAGEPSLDRQMDVAPHHPRGRGTDKSGDWEVSSSPGCTERSKIRSSGFFARPLSAPVGTPTELPGCSCLSRIAPE